MSSNTDVTDFAPYYIGNIVIVGLWITPLTIIWFISLCLARRRHDPARVGVAWLKAVYPIWIIALLLAIITSGLGLFLWYDNLSTDLQGVSQALNTIATTGSFFENVADILLFVTLVELGSGFLLCLNGGGPTAIRKYTRVAVLIWGLLLFILSLGLFAFNQSITARFYASLNDGTSYNDMGEAETGDTYSQSTQYTNDLNTVQRLAAAVYFLLWISSIPILVYASYVVHKTRNHPMLRSSAILLLVATTIDFSRLIANAAIFAASYLSTSSTNTVSPAVSFFVAAIFDYVFMFVTLVLLFVLAIRKVHGLWLRQGGWDSYNNDIAPYPGGGTVAYMPDGRPVQIFQVPPPGGMGPVPAVQGLPGVPGQTQGLPAYLQVAQQKAWEQQQQQQQQIQQQQQQGYGYSPQQLYQQHQQQQQQMVEPKSVTGVQAQDAHVLPSQAELGEENPREMHELAHGDQEYRH